MASQTPRLPRYSLGCSKSVTLVLALPAISTVTSGRSESTAIVVIYRVLFAEEGARGRILLALEAFTKKTQRTRRPPSPSLSAGWPTGAGAGTSSALNRTRGRIDKAVLAYITDEIPAVLWRKG